MKYGLAPLTCPDPIILVLGSLPDDESIRRQEYYELTAFLKKVIV